MSTNLSAQEALRPASTSRTSWSRLPRLDGLAIDAGLIAVAIGVEVFGTTVDGAMRLSWGWFVFYALALVALLASGGAYRRRLRPQLLEEIRLILGATAVAAMATISLSVLVSGRAEYGVEGARLWLFSLTYVAAGRAALSMGRVAAYRRRQHVIPTLIVGAGHVARLTAKRLREDPDLGLEPIGFLDKEPLEGDDSDLPVLGASWDLARVLDQYEVGQVIFTFSTAPHDVFLHMVAHCLDRRVPVAVVPRLFERMPGRVEIDHLGALPLVSVKPTRPDDLRLQIKYLLDGVLAAIGLIVLSPVLIAVAIGVLLSGGRPILFRQSRVGCDGQRFDMLKFRSMREPAPDEAGPDVAEQLGEDTAPGGIEGVDRRTRFGLLIRRWSLDELPQLFNVLRGEMSLVGPRPERPEFVELFSSRIERYNDRHRVRSGITGWAQIHGLCGQTSLSDRVEWDNWYIENWSLWLDLKVMLMTAGMMRRPRPVD